MEESKISIVIPVYNVKEYINRCIESIINQTYKNLEIILVNDGSTDGSDLICKEYQKKDNRIIIIDKENGGLSDARNFGIKLATGDYITFIDSDDYIKLDYIKYLYDLIKKGNYDISVCGYCTVSEDGVIKNSKLNKNVEIVLEKHEAFEELMYNNILKCSAWGKLYKLDLFNNIEYPYGRLFEDIGTTYKLIDKSNKLIVGTQKKYIYLVRKNSISHLQFSKRNMDSLYFSIEMCDYVESKYPQLKNATAFRKSISAINIIRKITKLDNNENLPELEYAERILNDQRLKIKINKKIATKDKLLIYISFLGNKFSRKIFKKI